MEGSNAKDGSGAPSGSSDANRSDLTLEVFAIELRKRTSEVKAKVHHDLLRVEFLAIYLTWFLAIYLTAIGPGMLVDFGLFTFWSHIPEFGVMNLWTWMTITAVCMFLALLNTVVTTLVLKYVPIRSTLGGAIDWLMEERKLKW
jgi:hypothetical protein